MNTPENTLAAEAVKKAIEALGVKASVTSSLHFSGDSFTVEIEQDVRPELRNEIIAIVKAHNLYESPNDATDTPKASSGWCGFDYSEEIRQKAKDYVNSVFASLEEWELEPLDEWEVEHYTQKLLKGTWHGGHPKTFWDAIDEQKKAV